jgi:hypothetical protein
VRHSEICSASCTNHARILHASCTHSARILHASCTHPARILYASCTHPARIRHASGTHPARILHASGMQPLHLRQRSAEFVLYASPWQPANTRTHTGLLRKQHGRRRRLSCPLSHVGVDAHFSKYKNFIANKVSYCNSKKWKIDEISLINNSVCS